MPETRATSTIAKDDVAAAFAATPPLECLRVVCSLVMSRPREEKRVLMFLDISRAHPHCRVRREVYIRLPEEDPRSQDPRACGKLRMALYGTRDAGQAFEFEVAEVCERNGCTKGLSNPCVYRVPERGLNFFHHDDDFVIGGPEEASKWLVGVLEQKFIVKDRGVAGPGPEHLKQISCLNRSIRWRGEYEPGGEAILYEADARHPELLRSHMGLKADSKGLSSPGVQVKPTPDLDCLLDSERTPVFKSACMRLVYLALDRPEIQFSSKECGRGMAAPNKRHWLLLKRVVRYIVRAPRVIWVWRRQRAQVALSAYTDTDWAGCPVTRRSSSCMMSRYGKHTVLTASTTQVPLALSSGEAEFYGAVKAPSRLSGMGQLSSDLGAEVRLELYTDSNAARGVLARRGTGKIRHLAVQTLWLQRQVQDGVFSVKRVAGKENPADLGTKYLPESEIHKAMKMLELYVDKETDESALRARVEAVERVRFRRGTCLRSGSGSPRR